MRLGEDILDPNRRSRAGPSVERITVEDDPNFPHFLLDYNRNRTNDEEPINEPDIMHHCRQCHLKQIRTSKPNVHCKKHTPGGEKKKGSKKVVKKKKTQKVGSLSPERSPRTERRSKKDFDVHEFTVNSHRDQLIAMCPDPICPKYYESLNPPKNHKEPTFYQKLADIEKKAKLNKQRLIREQAEFEERKLTNYAQRQLEQWKNQRNEEASDAYTQSKQKQKHF